MPANGRRDLIRRLKVKTTEQIFSYAELRPVPIGLVGVRELTDNWLQAARGVTTKHARPCQADAVRFIDWPVVSTDMITVTMLSLCCLYWTGRVSLVSVLQAAQYTMRE